MGAIAVVGVLLLWRRGALPLVSSLPAPAPVPGLVEVPLPEMRHLAEADRSDLDARREEVDRLAAARPVDAAALGEAYGRLGQVYMAFELVDAATPALANAEMLVRGEPKWPYYLGTLHLNNRSPGAATSAFRRALALDPNNAIILLRLGEALKGDGQSAESVRVLDESLAGDPELAAAHVALGEIAFDADDPATAVRHWEAALALQPAATRLYRSLAMAYQRLGDSASAEAASARRGDTPVSAPDAWLGEVVALRQAAGSRLVEGGRAMEAGRFADAVALFRQVVSREPDNVTARVNLGAALMKLGDADGAASELREALRLDPDQTQARFNLALLAWHGGRRDEARAGIEAVLAREPDNAEARNALALLDRESASTAATER